MKRTPALALLLALAHCGPSTNFSDAAPSDAAREGAVAVSDGGIDAAATPDAARADAAPGSDAVALGDARGDGNAPDAGSADAAPVGPPMCFGAGMTDPPGTYTYAFSALVINRPSSTGGPITGFNLDAMHSAAGDEGGCRRADHFSTYDSDQHEPAGCAMGAMGCRGGVDNKLPEMIEQFSGLAGGDLSAAVNRQVGEGRFAIVLRVSGVDDLTNDSDVTVRVYAAYPSFSAPCRVFNDQEFQLAASSLRPDARSLDDAVFVMPGSIVNGRLRAAAPPASPFVLPLPGLAAGPVNLAVRDMRLRFDISATGGDRGNLGGRAQGNELVDELKRLLPALTQEFVRVFDELVDIREGGVCVDSTRVVLPTRPTMRYGSLGLGLGFSLVRARIDARCPVALAPAEGTCAAPGG